MYICDECHNEFGNKKTRNTMICPKCLGTKGGKIRKANAWPKKIKEKKINTMPNGYLYITRSMCTPKEIELLPGSGRIILLHRLAMAKYLNRPIQSDEVVMHKDGDKTNNSIDNLQLGTNLTNSQDHWQARQEAAQWQNLAINIFLAAKFI